MEARDGKLCQALEHDLNAHNWVKYECADIGDAFKFAQIKIIGDNDAKTSGQNPFGKFSDLFLGRQNSLSIWIYDR